MRSLVAAAWLFLLLPTRSVVAVKEQDFKKCNESAFCRRGRALADRAAEYPKSAERWKSPYSLDASTIVLEDGGSRFTGRVRSSLYPEIKFELDVRVHEDGVVRVRMDEKEGLRKRYDEAASWALLEEPILSSSSKWSVGKKDVKVVYGGKKDQMEVTVEFEPLVVRMRRNGKDQVVLNGQGLLHMEHFREKVEKKVEEVEFKDEEIPVELKDEGIPVELKDEGIPVVEGEEAQQVIQLPPNAWFEGDTEDGLWQESWRTWTDTKPKGALSYCFHLISRLTPVQVPSLFPSISTSLITATSTVSRNTPPVWTFQLPRAKVHSSMTHTDFITPTCSNTSHLPPCRCTDLFP